jgi:hypothetical protein
MSTRPCFCPLAASFAHTSTENDPFSRICRVYGTRMLWLVPLTVAAVPLTPDMPSWAVVRVEAAAWPVRSRTGPVVSFNGQ